MPIVTARCRGPSRQTQPPRFTSLGPKQHRGSEGSSHHRSPSTLMFLLSPTVERGVRKCCSPSLTCAGCLACIGTALAVARLCWGGPGCVAPAPHPEPLAEEGKAPGGLQGSKACGQQPTVPAWRTQNPKAFCIPANAFEWEPASSPHPAPKPAGSWTSGRGFPVFDGAKPLL